MAPLAEMALQRKPESPGNGKIGRIKGRVDHLREAQGHTQRKMAETMSVSVRRVQCMWRRYRNTGDIDYPRKPGRRPGAPPGRREHSAILSAYKPAC